MGEMQQEGGGGTTKQPKMHGKEKKRDRRNEIRETKEKKLAATGHEKINLFISLLIALIALMP